MKNTFIWASSLVCALVAMPQSILAADSDVDFQISDITSAGNFDAHGPVSAYNPTNKQHLVVWWGDSVNTGNEALELFGQLVGDTGEKVGSTFQISQIGETIVGDFTIDEDRAPAIAYNTQNDQYLVVWAGNGVGGEDDVEIFGEILSVDNAGTATVVKDDFQISDMGVGNSGNNAFNPAVAYDSNANQYLVVWEGDGLATNNEFEIFAELLSAGGDNAGLDDAQISTTGPDVNADFDAGDPDVAYNLNSQEYLVVWEGDRDTNGVIEIHGQRLKTDGALEGAEFQISKVNGTKTGADARTPGVSVNSSSGEYLVVWWGDKEGIGSDNNFQVFGRILDSAGASVSADDFLVSASGTASDGKIPTCVPVDNDPATPTIDETVDCDNSLYFVNPTPAYNTVSNKYIVVWLASDAHVHAARLGADAAVVEPDFQLSNLADKTKTKTPSVAHNPDKNEYLAVFEGDNQGGGTAIEIFGQRKLGPTTVRFSESTYSIGEADGSATITVERLGDAAGAVTVDFASTDDTATEGADYPAATGTVTFPDGDATAQTFPVAITDDTDVEGEETVNLALINPTGAALSPTQSSAVLTITDDDTDGGDTDGGDTDGGDTDGGDTDGGDTGGGSTDDGGGGSPHPWFVLMIALLGWSIRRFNKV